MMEKAQAEYFVIVLHGLISANYTNNENFTYFGEFCVHTTSTYTCILDENERA